MAAVTEPAVGDAAAYVDTRLRLTFDAPPVLGATGSVRIFRGDDGNLVDVIQVRGETDVLGPETGTNGGYKRRVRTSPLRIEGSTVTISPHSRALEPGVAYAVGISPDALSGTLGGESFTGLGAAAGWTFTTRAVVPTGADVTVDDDGTTADFRTVQGALDHLMRTQAVDTPASVTIANGVYEELLFLRSKAQVTLVGESRAGVVIRYENYEALNGGTGSSSTTATATPGGGRSLFLAETAELLTLDSLTLENTHRRRGSGDQAETLYYNHAFGRLIAKNVTFLSEQDTLQLKGYSWFYGCLVAGNMDFIWGANRVALFEQSELRMLGDSRSSTPSGGMLVQARTAFADDLGFVFLDSVLTHGAGPAGTEVAVVDAAATYLGRSGGTATYFDNVAYLRCAMDSHVTRLGWADSTAGQPTPNPAVGTAASGWREYGSTDLAGVPLELTYRSAAAHLLTTAEFEARYATRALIFADYGNGAGWEPQP